MPTARATALSSVDPGAEPPKHEAIDISGHVVMAGGIDLHSHIGGGQGADNSSPIQPDVRIYDSVSDDAAGATSETDAAARRRR